MRLADAWIGFAHDDVRAGVTGLIAAAYGEFYAPAEQGIVTSPFRPPESLPRRLAT